MQVTSAEYREEQKRDLRNESYVWVYLGIINSEAQGDAYVSSYLTPYSSRYIFQEPNFEAYYASLEENFSRVDGSFYFLPEDTRAYALFQGAVSDDIEQAITIDFLTYHDLSIKGLTIDFGEYYPTAFTITNGNETYNYTKDSSGIFVTEDIFSDTDYLTITPTAMVGGEQRLRIHSVTFGVGLTFDNTTLINTQRKNTIDHLSNALPVKQFSFTVDNLQKKFNKDNPYSFINFLEEGQTVTYEYGRKMDDNSIYRIPGGTVALKTWSSNDVQAKFNCVGMLDLMTDNYLFGEYDPNGITAYLLAQRVLATAGLDAYRIDSYLRNVIIKNPLPITTHKNCLQMIANASRSVLYEERDGRIVIQSSFKPEITSVTYLHATGYSDTDSILNPEAASYDYSTLENSFTKVDGKLRILRPHSEWQTGIMLPTGYISNALSNVNSELPIDDTHESAIVIEWEAQWNFYGLELEYPEWAIPQQLTVIGYANGAEVIRETHTETRHITTEFYNCDKVKILFEKTAHGRQRIHCKSIKIADVSNYNLTYHELADTPTATSIERVKNVETHYYNYSYEDAETVEIKKYDAVSGENIVSFIDDSSVYYDYEVKYTSGTGTITVTQEFPSEVIFEASRAGEVQISAKKYVNITKVIAKAATDIPSGWNEVTFNSPYYDYVVWYTDIQSIVHGGEITVGPQYSYYLGFRSNIEAEVQISAKKIVVSDSMTTSAVGEVGSTKVVKNQLIDNADFAQEVGEWVGDYYASDTEYTLVFRGEPALDCDDLIYLENKFVDKNLIRITDETLDTSTGMSTRAQKLTARRISYVER